MMNFVLLMVGDGIEVHERRTWTQTIRVTHDVEIYRKMRNEEGWEMNANFWNIKTLIKA